jgi:hypothetical protein
MDWIIITFSFINIIIIKKIALFYFEKIIFMFKREESFFVVVEWTRASRETKNTNFNFICFISGCCFKHIYIYNININKFFLA